jgi:DNA polymerase-1
MKMVNYGLVYGMSATRLADTIHVTRDKAQAIMDTYFEVLPQVRAWLDAQKRAALHNDKFYSTTAAGRIRRYPDMSKLDEAEARKQRNRMARQAMNTPIQGLSADVTKLAVATWYETKDNKKGRLVGVVHDEMVVEAEDGHAAHAGVVLARCMDKAQRKLVKLPREALPCPVAVVDTYWRH